MFLNVSVPAKAPELNEELTVLSVKDTSARLVWKPVPVSDLRGFLQHYQVCYTHHSSQSKGEAQSWESY